MNGKGIQKLTKFTNQQLSVKRGTYNIPIVAIIFPGLALNVLKINLIYLITATTTLFCRNNHQGRLSNYLAVLYYLNNTILYLKFLFQLNTFIANFFKTRNLVSNKIKQPIRKMRLYMYQENQSSVLLFIFCINTSRQVLLIITCLLERARVTKFFSTLLILSMGTMYDL